jgi:hypothetical protein
VHQRLTPPTLKFKQIIGVDVRCLELFGHQLFNLERLENMGTKETLA